MDKELNHLSFPENTINTEQREQLVNLIKSSLEGENLRCALEDYHEYDIAKVLELLTEEEREKLFAALTPQELSDVFAYVEDVGEYIEEMTAPEVAEMVEEMDADDAVDLLEELDDDKKARVIELMDEEASNDVKLISKYEDGQIGSEMTTNYIQIYNDYTIKQAMDSLVKQAADNDNISTIYVTDHDDVFYGVISLRELFIARSTTPLEDIVTRSYPCLYATDSLSDKIDEIKEYAELSLPVVDENNKLLGVLTSSTVVETVDEELGEDYAKLAGLTEEDDLDEPLFKSMLKRLPWLATLLLLGLIVSTVVGEFEAVIVALPCICFFQPMILDMSGNIGTQSLGVTVRLLSDEGSTLNKRKLIFKELRISAVNGFISGVLAVIISGLYLYFLKGQPFELCLGTAGCIGIALAVAMTVSGLMGTVIPIFFKAIKIDPAVASGPLIATTNDLLSAIIYYGLASVLLLSLV